MQWAAETIKGVAGYDVVGLFVGSEGTLGIATEITVKLLPRPRVVMTALIPFVDVLAAARAVNAVLLGGLLPRCLELLDDVALAAVAGKGVPFPAEAGAVVIAEVDGSSEEGVFAELNQLAAIARECGGLDDQLAVDGEQRERLWATRRLVSSALRQLQNYKVSEDIGSRSRLPDHRALQGHRSFARSARRHLRPRRRWQPHTNVLYQSRRRPRVELASNSS